jgi:hypothetical protein
VKQLLPTALRRMSNPMDRCLLSNVPRISGLQKIAAQTVETRINEAIQRMQIAVSDSYEDVSVFSIYWKSDDTGCREDSELFINTLVKHQNVKTFQRILDDDIRTVTSWLHQQLKSSEQQHHNPDVASSSSSIMQATPSPVVHPIASLSLQKSVRSRAGQK